mgnify:CR=1 FL=1
MFLNKNNNSSYGFEAPNIPDDTSKNVSVKFPTSEKVTPTITSNKASVDVNRQETIIDLGSVTAAQELTLVPTAANLNVGARVIVSWTSDTTARAVTVKVGADTVATLAGTISTKVNKQLVWDGSGFLAL